MINQPSSAIVRGAPRRRLRRTVSTARACRWQAAAALVALTAAVPAGAAPIAITVDDLPIYATDFPPIAQARTITTRLLAGFRRNKWSVTGFVNEGQLAGADRVARVDLLRQWIAAGVPLGNHTYTHLSLAITPPHAFIADIARGDHVVPRLMAAYGQRERWFRYPYLETGATWPARRAVEHWLAAHRFRVAPVSMENADWEFAEPYDDAVAHRRTDEAARIRTAYLDYTRQMVAWYQATARTLLGREPSYVFLLHANRLNSMSIDALAAILRDAGLTPTTLARAVADPAYRLPDHYVGDKGYVSEARWAFALGRPYPSETLPRIPADVAASYARIEAADPDTQAPVNRNPVATP